MRLAVLSATLSTALRTSMAATLCMCLFAAREIHGTVHDGVVENAREIHCLTFGLLILTTIFWRCHNNGAVGRTTCVVGPNSNTR